MPQPPGTQELSIAGPVGRLEALLDRAADAAPVAVAVVCHPHPQHGGTMHNKVAHTVARAFAKLDFAALRFNFRGTEGSEGRYDEGNGEVNDALAAAEFMRAEFPGLPLWLGGFSFVAAVAIKAAAATPVNGLISVAPAVLRFAQGLETQPMCPWLIVQGDEDELVNVDQTITWVNELEPGPELLVLPGVEHFFHGNLIRLREAVTDFVQKHHE